MESLLTGYSDIELTICKTCNRYKSNKTWVEYTDLTSLLTNMIKSSIKTKRKLSLTITLSMDRLTVIVLARGKINREKVTEEYVMPVKIHEQLCTLCQRKRSKYYEAIVQFRGVREEIIDAFVHFISKEKDEAITDEKEIDSGLDFYVTGKRVAEQAVRSLVKDYGGTYLVSPKLYSLDKQTSKKLYRLTIIYKQPEFFKNDVVLFNNKILKITHIFENIKAINLATGKQESFKSKEFKPEHLPIFEAIVNKVKPNTEVLHPETYQNIEVVNPSQHLKIGDKVKVVIFCNSSFLV